MSEQILRFKLTLQPQNDVRRFSIPPPATFIEFVYFLRQLLGFTNDIILKYTDEEGDLITCANDSDWKEAVSSAMAREDKTLRLTLRILSTPPPQEYLMQLLSLHNQDNNLSSSFSSFVNKNLQKESPVKESQKPPSEKEQREKEQREKEQLEKEQKEMERKQKEQKEKEQKVKEQKVKEQREKEQREKEQKEKEQREKEQREKEQKEKEQKEKEQKEKEQKEKEQNDPDQLVLFKTRSNQQVFLDVSEKHLVRFGLKPNMRVETPKGVGKVVGFDPVKKNIWFKIDSENGVSYWDDVKDRDSLYFKGILPLPEPHVHFAPLPQSTQPQNPSNTLDDEFEEAMIEIAIRESLQDTGKTQKQE